MNILKIGVIYLAELTYYIDDFAELYFNVLSSLSLETLRVLLSDNKVGRAFPLVLGSNSFTYKQTGAHLFWNSIAVAKQLTRHIKDRKVLDFGPKYFIIL